MCIAEKYDLNTLSQVKWSGTLFFVDISYSICSAKTLETLAFKKLSDIKCSTLASNQEHMH